MFKFTKHEAFHFILFLTVLLVGAVFLDAMSQDDDSVTGDASLKKLRKKIKKELQQAIGQAPKPKPQPIPTPTLPPQQAVSPTPQIIENAFLTLFERLSTKEGAPIDINSVPSDKPFRLTFKIQHQGIKEYRPIYTIEIADKNNQVSYKKSYSTELIKEGGFLEITEVISSDDAYGKNLKLVPGESYTIKVSISQKQGETNLADNEKTIKIKIAALTVQLPIVNMRVFLADDKTFTIGTTPLSLQAVTFDKPIKVNFVVENQGVPLYEPMYLLQILNDKGDTVYKTQNIKFDKPFTPREKRDISHEIDYEKYRVQAGKILAPLPQGNYKLKITIGKSSSSISETNVDDNQIIVPFTILVTTPQQTQIQLPAGTGKLQELSERPKAQQVGLTPANMPTVILPLEVGV